LASILNSITNGQLEALTAAAYNYNNENTMNTTKIQKQEYNRLKRKYEEVLDSLQKAELLCLQLKGKTSIEMNNSDEFLPDEESRLLYQLQTRQEIIQDLRYGILYSHFLILFVYISLTFCVTTECQSKKQRIEQLEQTVQLVNKIQEDNGKLIESNAVYKAQFTTAIQLLQNSITQQELQAVQVTRLICNFTEDLKQKLCEYDRVQISL
jgi:ribosomal protein S26